MTALGFIITKITEQEGDHLLSQQSMATGLRVWGGRDQEDTQKLGPGPVEARKLWLHRRQGFVMMSRLENRVHVRYVCSS